MLNNSDSNKHSDFYKESKTSFSLEKLLDDFSFWFPKAMDYGFTADKLYKTEDNAIVVAIPIPIVEEGNYKLWLFTFSRVERVTPRLRDLWLSDIAELFDLSGIVHLIHFEHHFIIADVIRSRITPKLGKKSIYVIRADYTFKVYEIISKAVDGFVRSFRKNVKYGDDLFALCDDLERFAEKLRRRADELRVELKVEIKSTSLPTRHPSANSASSGSDELRKEAEEYLALLEKSRVIR